LTITQTAWRLALLSRADRIKVRLLVAMSDPVWPVLPER